MIVAPGPLSTRRQPGPDPRDGLSWSRWPPRHPFRLSRRSTRARNRPQLIDPLQNRREQRARHRHLGQCGWSAATCGRWAATCGSTASPGCGSCRAARWTAPGRRWSSPRSWSSRSRFEAAGAAAAMSDNGSYVKKVMNCSDDAGCGGTWPRRPGGGFMCC